MKFSIFVVTLNAGSDLSGTLDSILAQENVDFEIIIKDGLSTDGSLSFIPDDPRIKLFSEKDTGIYNAMNQAVQYASGDYGMFINCGDAFYNAQSLKSIEEAILRFGHENRKDVIFYGDCYFESRGYCVHYPEVFNDYTCFTITLCHQATVYPVALLQQRPFQEKYRFAADCEYYVHAYNNGVSLVHLPVVMARYKGNGFTEANENRKKSLLESKQILKEHFTKDRYRKTWRKAVLHGVGIKQYLVQQNWFYPAYCTVAKVFYKLKNK